MAKIIYDYYNGIDLYSDGEIENKIYDIVKKHDAKYIEEMIEKSNDWAILYHLSKNRQNILIPCDIKKEDYCLEIGSGCGAITEGILKYSENVDAIELSKKRSLINYERNICHDNLNIYVGNFVDIEKNLEKKYDKIFLIGVLEYSSLYIKNSDNPFLDLLKIVKNHLKEDGNLYIAIENKYGMKYFSGAREDHTGNFFESIEGYDNNTAKTFSNISLRKLLKKANYKNIYFYYPLPDYKFPNEIYSEDYLPKNNSLINLGHSLDRNRSIIFNETKALNEAAKSDHFETFANSFLIKAGV